MQVQYHYGEVTHSDLPTEVGAEQVLKLWAVALQFAILIVITVISSTRDIQQFAIIFGDSCQRLFAIVCMQLSSISMNLFRPASCLP